MPTRPIQRVLYVEDEPDIQRIARLSLERIGKMTVEVVGDPTAAIEAIINFKPDLVLLDWMMPALDGPALFTQMKLRPETKSIPVVFMTAKAARTDLDWLIQLGAVATIAKPFAPKDLPDQIRSIWKDLPEPG